MILSQAQQIKSKIIELAKKAVIDGVMTESEFKTIIERLEQEKIVIGICGQVKSGKTTFINALLFGKNVLPVASTPMTASLCYLTYGERPEVEVEFFTREDWDEIQESVNSSDNEIAQSAREFIEHSRQISHEIPALLGTRKTIDFNMLGDYVGSKGKYTSIVKAIKIKLPEEILKDIELVDTPGINDPVVSRERRTLEFLKRADIVFLFTYAGRAFDESDMKFMRRLKNSAGKVIIVVNKKDELYLSSEEENLDAVRKRLIEELEKLKNEAIRLNESKFTINLIDKAKEKIVFFSSLWALLGKMKEEEIITDEDLSFHYERFREELSHLKTPDDFLRESGLSELETAIREVLQEKFMLIKSLVKPIEEAYRLKINNIDSDINRLKLKITALENNKEIIKSELKKLKEIEKEARGLLEETAKRINDEYRDGYNELMKKVKDKFKKFYETIEKDMPEKEFFTFQETYQKKCESFFERTLMELVSELNNDLRYFAGISKKAETHLQNFFTELTNNKLIEELLITKDIFYKNLDNFKEKHLAELKDILNINKSFKFVTSGWWFIGNKLAREEIIKQALEEAKKIENEIIGRVDEYKMKIQGEVNKLKNSFIDEIIQKIKEPLQEAEVNYSKRDKEIEKLKNEIKELEQTRANFESKFNEVKSTVRTIENL